MYNEEGTVPMKLSMLEAVALKRIPRWVGEGSGASKRGDRGQETKGKERTGKERKEGSPWAGTQCDSSSSDEGSLEEDGILLVCRFWLSDHRVCSKRGMPVCKVGGLVGSIGPKRVAVQIPSLTRLTHLVPVHLTTCAASDARDMHVQLGNVPSGPA